LIQNYIELEQLRYADRLELTFEKDIGQEIEIPPLVLLSLVENAFKHGAAEDEDSPDIDISVKSDVALFLFKVSNSIAKDKAESDKDPIGLNNIQKQLELLYGDRYNLQIDKTEDRFSVTLRIEQDK
jgi:LytS/YehU family sensor histidine kinase